MDRKVSTFVSAARKIVGDGRVSVELGERSTASKDRYELSPLLRERLPATVADVVVWPSSTADIERLLEAAYAASLPVTARGKGTGNYGQAVPLECGAVLDMSRMTRIIDLGTGWINAQAGARFFDLERRARSVGQELAIMPTTVGSTIGGFIAGGSAGAGSIKHGWVWDGFVQRLCVVPCTQDSSMIDLVGDSTRPYAHGYGTTGIISEVVVGLDPANEWISIFVSLPDIETAVNLGREIMGGDPAPRLLSIDPGGITTILAVSQPEITPGRVSLRAVVAQEQVDRLKRAVTLAGGAVSGEPTPGMSRVLSLAFNHVTERVLDATEGYCHLQASGLGLATAEKTLSKSIPGIMVHLDGFRLNNSPEMVGIIFHEYSGPLSIVRATQILADHGVRVNDPHVWQLQKNLELYRSTAAVTDPRGLLNPGKLPAEG